MFIYNEQPRRRGRKVFDWFLRVLAKFFYGLAKFSKRTATTISKDERTQGGVDSLIAICVWVFLLILLSIFI